MLTAQRREHYSRDELLRAVYMAGRGNTARDIAATLRTSPRAVYSLLFRLGFPLQTKHEEEEIASVHILRQHMDMFGRVCTAKHLDPMWLVARIIRVVASDKELFATVLEKVGEMQPEAKAKRARGA